MERTPKYAGFWIRFLAICVDSFILGVIGSFLTLLTGGDGSALEAAANGAKVHLNAGMLGLSLVYYAGFWIWRSTTPGKMLFKLKIVQEKSGKPMTVSNAVIRYVGTFVSGLVFCLGYIWVAFSAKKQGWHDIWAGTVVVSTEKGE